MRLSLFHLGCTGILFAGCDGLPFTFVACIALLCWLAGVLAGLGIFVMLLSSNWIVASGVCDCIQVAALLAGWPLAGVRWCILSDMSAI